MTRIAFYTALLSLTLLLAGCGVKGDLTLPDTSAPVESEQ